MLLLSILLTLSYPTSDEGWSRHNPADEFFGDDDVPKYVLGLSPAYASLLSAAVLLGFWLTMVLMIVLSSLMGKPYGGLIVYISILFLSITVRWEEIAHWIRPSFGITNYARFMNVGLSFPGHELEALPWCRRAMLCSTRCSSGDDPHSAPHGSAFYEEGKNL